MSRAGRGCDPSAVVDATGSPGRAHPVRIAGPPLAADQRLVKTDLCHKAARADRRSATEFCGKPEKKGDINQVQDHCTRNIAELSVFRSGILRYDQYTLSGFTR